MKDFKNGREVMMVEYELAFDDGHYNGFAFPCDKDGNLLELNDEHNKAAKENYEYCLAHADEFVRAGVIDKREWTYREPNSGVCNCGKRIELFDQYLGGCECPYCGQWWNIWGQELNDPSTWRMGEDW